MKNKKESLYRFTKLIPALLLFVWSILPSVCATMCQERLCCKTALATATQTKLAGTCTHCSADKAIKVYARSKDSANCCLWIASRLDPPATDDKFSFVHKIPAIVPHLVSVQPEMVLALPAEPPAYIGLAPPKPPAFPAADRAPPMG